MSYLKSGEIKVSVGKVIYPYTIYVDNKEYMGNISSNDDIYLTGLESKYYSIKIIDGNGDSVTKSIFVPKNEGIIYDYSSTNVSSHGTSDGTIDVRGITNDNSEVTTYNLKLYKKNQNWDIQYNSNTTNGYFFTGKDYGQYKVAVSEIGCSNNTTEEIINIYAPPVVTTNTMTKLSISKINAYGEVTYTSELKTKRGFCWISGDTGEPTINNNNIINAEYSSNIGVYNDIIFNLKVGIPYRIRAFAQNSAFNNYSYGVTKIKIIEDNRILNSINKTIAGKDFVFTAQHPVASDINITMGNKETTIKKGTDRAVITFGVNGLFTILPEYDDYYFYVKQQPIISYTKGIINIGQNSATSGGYVQSGGGGVITSRGVCWALSDDPTTGDTKTNNGSGVGDYTSNLIGLIPDTTYYVSAYVINEIGVGYGEVVSFKTLAATLPTATTKALIPSSSTTMSSGGELIANGGVPVTAYGVCWNTTGTPTTADTKTTNGTLNQSSFTETITVANIATTYYVRAYVTNIVGTSYGNEVVSNFLAPTIRTADVSSIANITATSGGIAIDARNGGQIYARGVCWSTGITPTTGNAKTTDGTGTVDFISGLVNLTEDTTYYVRAYAINYAGVGYGNTKTFTTYKPSFRYDSEFLLGVLEETYTPGYQYTSEFVGYVEEEKNN